MKKRHGLSTDYDAAQHWRGLAHAHECIMKKNFYHRRNQRKIIMQKNFIFFAFFVDGKEKMK